jgi:hypothetical protein
MFRFQYSMAGLMAAVLLVALACAALLSDSQWVASAAFTAHVALFALAVVGAIARSGDARIFWVGVAVFSWAYSQAAWPDAGTVWHNPWDSRAAPTHPGLLTDPLLDAVAEIRVPRHVGAKVSAQWSNSAYYAATIVEIKDGMYRVSWDDRSPDSWVRIDQMRVDKRHTHAVGHAVLGTLIALGGGVLCRRLFAARNRKAEEERVQSTA